MEISNEGKSGSVRVEALDGTDLSAMERHGYREDASGKARRVSDDKPLVHGGLDICERQKNHTAGRKQQGRSKALHALVQFPSELIPNTERAQKVMLKSAVDFINKTYGGDAVFAARLDRDEKGTHKVDVFFMPRWDFTYKDGRTQSRCGIGSYTKAEAKRRYGSQDRRAQGSALQDALFEHLRDNLKVPGVMPPKRKATTTRDRVEPEVFALRKNEAALEQKQEEQALRAISDANELSEGRQAIILATRAVEARKKAVAEEEARLAEARSQLTRETSILVAARLAEGQTVDPDLLELDDKNKARRSHQRQRTR